MRQNAIGFRYSTGSNANGRWRRLDGIQECWHTLTLTFNSGTAMTGTWTFPVEFSAAANVRVFVSLRNAMAGAAPNIGQISGTYNNTAPTTTQTTVRVSRVTGQTDFTASDTLAVDVYAQGLAP